MSKKNKPLESIRPCPESGEGVHSWIFHVACTFFQAGVSVDDAREYCELHASRALQPNEVENAFISLENKDVIGRAIWPKKSEWLIEVAIRESKKEAGVAAAILAGKSRSTSLLYPLGCGSWDKVCVESTDIILKKLFPEDPLICCGKTTWQTQTKRLSEINPTYLSECQFIVPNSMSSETGTTQAGQVSNRSLSNTGDREYLVVEFDDGTHEDHAALLQCLDGYESCPLMLALTSGNKSLHGWFDVRHVGEDKAKLFFKKALKLGADKATWTKSQLVRMPNGSRPVKNNSMPVWYQKQQVYYANPCLN